MREKELRIALVCYGGISLAVYMHGITKEVWRLAKAGRHRTLDMGRPEHPVLARVARAPADQCRADYTTGGETDHAHPNNLATADMHGNSPVGTRSLPGPTLDRSHHVPELFESPTPAVR